MKGDSQAVYCNEIAYISEISCVARDDGRKRRGYEVTCGRVVLAVFIIALVLYRRTPIPKGCEDLQATQEKCGACTAKDCPFKQRLDKIKKKEEEEK